jgi:hypothetical protein
MCNVPASLDEGGECRRIWQYGRLSDSNDRTSFLVVNSREHGLPTGNEALQLASCFDRLVKE